MSLYWIVTTFAMAFIITVIGVPLFIPFLQKLKFGQSIREEGPQSHLKKSGTPTMGGLVFLLAMIISFVIMTLIGGWFGVETLLLLIPLVLFGALGFLDDYIKVVKKQNLGLRSKQKFLGQVAISILFYCVYHWNGYPDTLTIPFTSMEINLGWFFLIFIIFWLVGFSNAVNLTDGLDGLVSGLSVIAFGAFGIIAIFQNESIIAMFCFAIVGAMLGFLLFNKNPAKIFMGDTGSLALGGAIAAISILLKQEWMLLLIGLVFVIETSSVIIQVFYFKVTNGKRLFKMSPIHHHFEHVDIGWSEWRIVLTFWGAGLISAIIALFIAL
ncbi:phospho-N-acetylmuramoyl-pentapeptide-transferase [Paenilisteria rocourtiae]|uniref:Phospho-N-acetylmuramoyl-pentapeptide-transferase n=1 Tax=Listeria rocourtiae TaxID=647910 RepID=A0A4R6ZRT1_9LIST|nr:phospho-N-acetylmuramoyl-pentapeptide-transferase [Listeria rocourtiae]EUJ45154.1 phospho-N-acetylmuramoyl-pentapeptide-transferase [Listeria rocourtiae FSL F6-920]MBC1434631.1 phospho-N-acetylmuramoyl-pentapeptide-transferase [Listeria rocourtiae]MBC1603323.1 phospho-N-acetylmuramoyl-pentapeptide-transferase [Listeria rocourtiae]TDR55391.1 phospho-N-acetylmuramoyl-pentapeptide-transferase [Listeria rocourtiae]